MVILDLFIQVPLKPTHTKEIEDFKGDELFKQVQMPNSLLHKIGVIPQQE